LSNFTSPPAEPVVYLFFIKEITDLQRVSISEWFRGAAELALNTKQEEDDNDFNEK